ncbi:hypothetical protein EW146_g363 [Bondarzewia mesenterica]|uniref:Uncharacterized protein n=1 Tax=Bondarzewia mesenterica TaxID=1095465 RepID=A0A4S4MDL1_9AGAM|nr:hypothetical protein EW146_g363 [Bondarzewia mesenterica]
MALGSTSASGSVPTATGSPTPSQSQVTDPAPNFFATGTSPPLIIGFIAVAIFAVGVIGLCAWRRMVGRGRHILVVDDWDGLEGEKKYFAEKPKLFECWLELFAGGIATWENIMPLATSVVTDNARDTEAFYVSTSKLWWRKKGRPDEDQRSAIPGRQVTSASRLQLAVIVTMPSQHRGRAKGHETSIMSDNFGDQEPSEYTIGLVEMPWRMQEQSGDAKSMLLRSRAGSSSSIPV